MPAALPPLNDTICCAVAELVNDAMAGAPRFPSHSDIDFVVTRACLGGADPKNQGQTVGKAKRVRAILSWAIENDLGKGQALVSSLLSQLRGQGGFRSDSPNFVGVEAIRNIQGAFEPEGFVLSDDGTLQPKLLDTLSGKELTDTLSAYARRAQKGAEDAALVVGTGKDLLEAVAAHVLVEKWSVQASSIPQNFPTLLGQAFVAVGLVTSQNIGKQPTARERFQAALFDAACAINTLRNKEGTGHGHPWASGITPTEAKAAIQTMGLVANMLLDALKLN